MAKTTTVKKTVKPDYAWGLFDVMGYKTNYAFPTQNIAKGFVADVFPTYGYKVKKVKVTIVK